jgi:hypothetical protein
MSNLPAMHARKARGSSGIFALLAAICAIPLLAGCGKSAVVSGSQEEKPVAETGTLLGSSGAGGILTANTARLGGEGPVQDAAAIARAVYPGFAPGVRPHAVVIVEADDWPVALAAASLSGAPLRAPILYAEDGRLPAVSAAALHAMRPLGVPALAGAQVIAVGVSPPVGYRSLSVDGPTPYAIAAHIAALLHRLQGGRTSSAVIAGATAPAAFSMPAAGLAAESGAPILLAGARGAPRATIAALRRLGRPATYAIGPESAIGAATMSQLQRSGEVTRIGASTPVVNAFKVAAFTNGHFGWGVDEPGHGFVFARESRPLDAPAAALLSATGDYAPLLLLSGAEGVPPTLARYLTDIQPAYGQTPESAPVRGVYNRGWLIGDRQAISLRTQSQLDVLLRSVPRSSATSPPSLVP